MIISTRNETAGGRRITRAIRDTQATNYRYTQAGGTIPSLIVSLSGSDGKSYNVVLADGDIRSINEARAKYAEHFERYK